MKIEVFTFNSFAENTYLLIDEDSKVCIVIDAGCSTAAEKSKLESYIKDNSLTLKRVLNTHLHFDHWAGNAFLYQTFGVKPEASEKDEFLLGKYLGDAERLGFNVELQPIGGHLSHGDVIREGSLELHVIEVLGHSPGGLAFHCPNEGVLFSGDTLFQSSIGRTDLSGGSYADIVNSISKRLLTLPEDTIVYPGHGGTTTIGYEKQYNPYL